MYSKNKNISPNSYPDLTPPPGYDGSRLFTKRERNDGRDENYVVHTRPIYRGRDKGRDNDMGMPPDGHSRKSRSSAPQQETEAPIEVIYDNMQETPEEYPPFPGIETFLEEEDDFWEEGDSDTAPPCAKAPEENPREECKNKPAGLVLPEPLSGLLRGLDREDLLLIGLIVLLSGEKNMNTGDILLLLALLLITK